MNVAPTGTSRRGAFLVCVAAVLGGARGLAACGDDPAPAPPALEGGDGSSPRGPDAARPRTDAEAPDSAGPPTFCEGIVLFASFDQRVEAELGGGVTRDAGSVGLVDGRFGRALSLVSTTGQGALVYYDRGDGGAPVVYPEAEGTLAYWFKPTAEATNTRVHVRPLGSGTASAGLAIASVGGSFGLWTDLGGARVLTFSEADLSPFLRASDFDHLAFVWKRGDVDAGAPFLARLAVNGGSGEVIGDASVDAAQFADASTDDAGNVRVPYRAQTNAPWPEAFAPLATLRLGGVAQTSAQGAFDDLAVWSRALSFEEIEALYRSGASVRDRCGL